MKYVFSLLCLIALSCNTRDEDPFLKNITGSDRDQGSVDSKANLKDALGSVQDFSGDQVFNRDMAQSCEIDATGKCTPPPNKSCTSILGPSFKGEISCDETCAIDTSECFQSFVYVTSGNRSSCALTKNGEVKCWGVGNLVPPPGILFKQIDAKSGGVCGISQDDEIHCWGKKQSPPTGEFKFVASGLQFSCAINMAGILECWGLNEYNLMTNRPKDGGYVSVVIGTNHGCALKKDGLVKCWSGDGAPKKYFPIELSRTPFTQIDSTLYASCGILEQTQRISCWGASPKTPIMDQFVDVSVGSGNQCGLTVEGRLKCWAWSKNIPSPPKSGVYTFSQFTLGYDHGCGVLTNSGKIVCWGNSPTLPK